MKRYCILLCLTLMLAPGIQAYADPYINTETFKSEDFSSLVISGPINVKIVTRDKTPWVKLEGDSQSLANVYAAVKNGTLYLSMNPAFIPSENNHIIAIVNNCLITDLQYYGSGQVGGTGLTGTMVITATGSGTVTLLGNHLDLRTVNVGNSSNVHVLGIDSNLLNVLDNSSGKVNLGGKMVLQDVTYNGSGPLSIYWVTSTDVKVEGNGTGRVFIAGVANLLDVTLANHTWLDARYLRAKRAFVNTRDDATADVWTRCTLGALATGTSSINYYNNPGFAGNYMLPPGMVLNYSNLDANNLPMPAPPC